MPPEPPPVPNDECRMPNAVAMRDCAKGVCCSRAGSARAGRLVRAVALALALTALHAVAQDEDALAKLWADHTARPDDHEGLLTACTAFGAQRPADPFRAVSESLAAWHLLKLGRNDDAAARLQPWADDSSTPLRLGASLVARSWLTRLDRERVRSALQFFYRKKVRYPYTLGELTADKLLPANLVPPLKDRWGVFWRYELVGFKNLPDLRDQKYELQSVELGAASDLAAALALPCGDGVRVQPVRMRSSSVAGHEAVEVSGPAGDRLMLTTGIEDKGLLLAHVGARVLVLCSRGDWKLLPRPEAP
jgi:hypothetical protein